MNTLMTIDTFERLVEDGEWKREQDVDVVEEIQQPREEWDEDGDPCQVHVPHVFGVAELRSECEGVRITYTEGFNYDRYQPETLNTGTEGQNDVWFVEGATVVDEDGEPMSAHELADYLDERFSRIDYSELQIEEIQEIDTDEDSTMETITLRIDNQPDIRFTGERIAHAASTDNNAHGTSYSGQTGRWTELSLYRTRGGKFVCHQIGRTRWQGEQDRFSGKVCETEDEVIGFFGHRWLAKELYEDAGMEDVVEVD
ncbi:hypothetical protein [Thioalkalivibrio sp. ALE19]|uniref:hypothetical protein n=1 Tax=Thioalkalivibrio sp. ALE19 TaxID=1266909 RepID=UPI0004243F69|nr:hypothetical protein [Thioalkalivibrio sp. ALE19]